GARPPAWVCFDAQMSVLAGAPATGAAAMTAAGHATAMAATAMAATAWHRATGTATHRCRSTSATRSAVHLGLTALLDLLGRACAAPHGALLRAARARAAALRRRRTALLLRARSLLRTRSRPRLGLRRAPALQGATTFGARPLLRLQTFAALP